MTDMRDTVEVEVAEDERRRARRRFTTLPVRIDTTTRPDRLAIIRNVSRTGALLATRSRFRIGAKAVLLFKTEAKGKRSAVEARIVRLELNSHDGTGLWPYLAAVSFETPLESSINVAPAGVEVR
ncbi:MAG: PilZ domain-containing protein [Deltaproteobacteria bacterium]|nr:PilZ domain-containing protein [Deltaproteobacteria bacterium]